LLTKKSISFPFYYVQMLQLCTSNYNISNTYMGCSKLQGIKIKIKIKIERRSPKFNIYSRYTVLEITLRRYIMNIYYYANIYSIIQYIYNYDIFILQLSHWTFIRQKYIKKHKECKSCLQKNNLHYRYSTISDEVSILVKYL